MKSLNINIQGYIYEMKTKLISTPCRRADIYLRFNLGPFKNVLLQSIWYCMYEKGCRAYQ